MREDEFKYWLQQSTDLTPRAQVNAISRCRRVERFVGDLDQHFQQDRLRTLLSRFEYSTEDEECDSDPRHSIPINGNIWNGTASLSSAVRTYKQFYEEWPAIVRARSRS